MREILVTLCALALSSCSDGWSDRGRDAMDVVTFCLGAGPELSCEVRLTDAVHVGFGGGIHAETGMLGRHVGHASIMTLGFPFGFMAKESVFFGRYVHGETGGAWGVSAIQDECYVIHALPLGSTQPQHAWVDSFNLEVAATALIGVRLGISLGQGIDFLGGCFGWDPAGDDDASHPAD